MKAIIPKELFYQGVEEKARRGKYLPGSHQKGEGGGVSALAAS